MIGMQDIHSGVNLADSQQSGSDILSRDVEIYQNIYTAIVEHYIAPGTKLPEDALAESFKVSRTIIRKVLLGLAHDGLVTCAPKRGARVAKPTVEEGKEVFEARRLVEVAAIPLVVDVMTKAQIKALRKLVHDQKKAQLAQDFRGTIRCSGDFHAALIAVTGNKSLLEFLRKLISRSSLIVAVYGSTRGSTGSCQDHDELLDLIAARKVDASRHWMEQHLRDVEATLDYGGIESQVPDFEQVFSTIRARRTR